MDSLLLLKGYIIVGALLLFATAERLWNAATQSKKLMQRRIGRNLALWLINSGISPLIILPITFWASGLDLWHRPQWWSGGTGLLLDLVLLDAWIYWWHRLNHEVPFLWRFHQVHHFDENLDVSTAVRFHFGEVILSSLARASVIVALAIPFNTVLVFELLVMCAAIFHHSNLRLSPVVERWLSKLIITPGIHWVHHANNRRDTDSNYATVLSVWDRLFASRSPSARTLDMTLGVEGEHDQSLPRLVLLPFRKTYRPNQDGIHRARDNN